MNSSTEQFFSDTRARSSPRSLTVAAATLFMAVALSSSYATDQSGMIIVKQEGGISPSPVIRSVTGNTNKTLTLSWQSFGKQTTSNGAAVVYQVVKCPALKGTNSTWTSVGSVTNANTLTAQIDSEIGFLSVQQTPAPDYAGAEACGRCHDDTHAEWMTTAHAGAFDTLKSIHMDKNPSCVVCHTVGYGTPNGFMDEATTPQLAGVQCENCHGPAAGHAAHPLDSHNQVDLTKIPVRTLSAEMCGGCHSDVHHPTYEEWSISVHGTTQIPAEEFADPTNGPPRMATCGACHSAATRVALLNEVEIHPNPPDFNPELPSTQEASTTPITCAACHDPHSKTDAGAQLRFPLASKVPYSYSTATNFAANFNPDVQTCAQCHNMRGATWTGTSRPPHHSPQYNVLIGNGGYQAGVTNAPQSAHMDIETQCAQCHTHAHSPPAVTETSPNYMGHDFTPTMQACAPCHDEVGAGLIMEAVQTNVKEQITEIKGLLDQWATTKAPTALTQKYGNLAWEFTTIGQLSTTNALSQTGPNSTEQKLVPDGIKQARYNLYLVDNDHSYGVHNGNYTRFLLKVARDQVNGALAAQ
jgi:hypothetical protein